MTKLLLQDYAGTVSEDTAIHFIYVSKLFCKVINGKNFSEAIEKIAIVEMRHLELLGKQFWSWV